MGTFPKYEKAAELMEEGVVFQFGRPPYRIDLLNQIDGVAFSEAWDGRETSKSSAPASDRRLLSGQGGAPEKQEGEWTSRKTWTTSRTSNEMILFYNPVPAFNSSFPS